MEAIIFLLIYIAPCLIAAGRQHHQTGPISVITLLLGWTGIGWIVALAWSFSATK